MNTVKIYAKTKRGIYKELLIPDAQSEREAALIENRFKKYPKLWAAIMRVVREDQRDAWEAHGERMVQA